VYGLGGSIKGLRIQSEPGVSCSKALRPRQAGRSFSCIPGFVNLEESAGHLRVNEAWMDESCG